MSTAVRNVPLPTQASAGDDPAVDARIAHHHRGQCRARQAARAARGSVSSDDARPRDAGADGAAVMVAATPVSANAAIAAEPPALGGTVKAVTAVALALGTFMQVLDTTIANVSIPTIAGNLGVSSDQGTWVITSFAVANGVSVPLTGWLMQRFGVVRTFVVSVRAVHHRLVPVRPRLEPALADRVSRAAGRGLRAHDSRQSGAAHQCVRAREAHHGAGHLVDHHAGGADRRAPARRLYLRQLRLAVDLPHQCAGGHRSARCMCWNNLKSQETPDAQAPDRPRGPGAAVRLGGRAAGHARQGQGSRLVQLAARSCAASSSRWSRSSPG